MALRLWPRRRAARWGVASALGLAGAIAAALGTLCVTSGCASIDYLGQSASGHIHLLAAARPVKDAIADPTTPEALRKRLELTQRMREFAVTDLDDQYNLSDGNVLERYGIGGSPWTGPRATGSTRVVTAVGWTRSPFMTLEATIGGWTKATPASSSPRISRP